MGSRRLFLLRTQPPQSPQPPRFAVAAGAEVEEREGYDLRPDLGNGGAHARPASHEPAAQRARRVPVAEPPVQAGPVEDVVAALQLPDLLPDPDLAQAHRALRGRSAAVPGRAEPVVHSESPRLAVAAGVAEDGAPQGAVEGPFERPGEGGQAVRHGGGERPELGDAASEGGGDRPERGQEREGKESEEERRRHGLP